MSYNQYNNTNHFYPRSPCGERPERSIQCYPDLQISIHALLAESDGIQPQAAVLMSPISIHALLAESDMVSSTIFSIALVFLSTLSLRRATRNIANSKRKKNISIHALLAESDFHKRASIV